MKRIRLTSLICLTALLIGAVSCRQTESPVSAETQPDEPQTTTAPEKGDMLSSRQSVSDGLPEADFGGKPFTIAINTFCETGFTVPELTGDVLDDAVYNRNKTIEERFNVQLNYVSEQYNDTLTHVRNSILAADDAFQLVAEHAIVAGGLVTGDLLMNWYEIPNIDFDQPWWSPSNEADLSFDGVSLLAVGDFALTAIGRTYCMAFDKIAAESYGIGDLYQTVYDGKWTFDLLRSLSKDAYQDLNRNNERDYADYYGFSTSVASKIGVWLWAFDNPIFRKGSDGLPVLVMNSEKLPSILEKLISFCWDDENVYYDVSYEPNSNDKHYVSEKKFADSTTLFASIMLESGIQYFRDVEHDYAILPYPKWDEEQSDYKTIVDGGFSALAVPKTVTAPEMVGIITEALCAETWRSVVPVYYELALKEKGARDEESKEMIDYIVSKRVFDFGYVFDAWKGFGFTLEKMVREQNPNFASTYASNLSAAEAHYQSVIDVFRNYGK